MNDHNFLWNELNPFLPKFKLWIESLWASIMAMKHSNIMLKNKILNLIICVVRSWPCLTFGGKRIPVAGFSVSGRVGTRPLTHYNIPRQDLVWPDANKKRTKDKTNTTSLFLVDCSSPRHIQPSLWHYTQHNISWQDMVWQRQWNISFAIFCFYQTKSDHCLPLSLTHIDYFPIWLTWCPWMKQLLDDVANS